MSKKWMIAPPILVAKPISQNKTSKPINVQTIFAIDVTLPFEADLLITTIPTYKK